MQGFVSLCQVYVCVIEGNTQNLKLAVELRRSVCTPQCASLYIIYIYVCFAWSTTIDEFRYIYIFHCKVLKKLPSITTKKRVKYYIYSRSDRCTFACMYVLRSIYVCMFCSRSMLTHDAEVTTVVNGKTYLAVVPLFLLKISFTIRHYLSKVVQQTAWVGECVNVASLNLSIAKKKEKKKYDGETETPLSLRTLKVKAKTAGTAPDPGQHAHTHSISIYTTFWGDCNNTPLQPSGAPDIILLLLCRLSSTPSPPTNSLTYSPAHTTTLTCCPLTSPSPVDISTRPISPHPPQLKMPRTSKANSRSWARRPSFLSSSGFREKRPSITPGPGHAATIIPAKEGEDGRHDIYKRYNM